MNICQVILADGLGGAEAWVHELARVLRNKGENVSLITTEEVISYYSDLEDISTFNIGTLYPHKAMTPYIPEEKIRVEPFHRAFVLFYRYLDEILYSRYYERLREGVMDFLSLKQIDIIHSHLSLATILVSKLAKLGIPTVATPHGEHAVVRLRPRRIFAEPLVQRRLRKFGEALSKTDKVTVVSNFMLDALEGWGIPLVGKPVSLPIGVDVAKIRGSERSKSKLKGEFNLLFPGGAKRVKGGDLLVAALANVRQEIDDIHLYIGLNVPHGHMLRKMVTDLGLERNVTFTGFLQKSEYESLLSSVDLFVLPSRVEAFPLAIIEAMAMGKPIVAANTGGIPDAIENGRNGILVGLDPDEIAQAILCLCRNGSLRKEISQNNLKDIARFDLSSVVDQHINLYTQMLKGDRIKEEKYGKNKEN